MEAFQKRWEGKSGGGFTLIELLIVVAIIAILAAIAVPNFLEAQTRAKVSRVKSDFRSITVALESYYVDYNSYPWQISNPSGNNNRGEIDVYAPGLSTPVAYITSTNLRDPFQPNIDQRFDDVNNPGNPNAQVGWNILYVNIDKAREERNWNRVDTKWALVSYGPDKGRGPFPPSLPFSTAWVGNYRGTQSRGPRDLDNYFATSSYDATNGTRSGGDILRWSAGQIN